MKTGGTFLKGIIGGLVVGGVLFLLKKFGFDTSFAVPTLLGALVLLLDYLCLKPLLIRIANKTLSETGIETEATIDEIINSAFDPKNITRDEDGNFVIKEEEDNIPTMYEIKISYMANEVEYIKHIIVPDVTATELLPYRIREGEKIPIKYMKEDPTQMIIDIPAVTYRFNERNEDFAKKGPVTAFVITAIYLFWLFKRIL